MKKQTIAVSAVSCIIGAASVVGIASAATGVKPASLASEIAAKFHLNQSDVQSVIDQHKTEMQNYRQENYQARLDADVKAGKITSAQEQLILQEHQQILSFLQSLKGKSAADRKTALQTERTQVEQWEKTNNIPDGYLGFPGHHGFGHGPLEPHDDNSSNQPAT